VVLPVSVASYPLLQPLKLSFAMSDNENEPHRGVEDEEQESDAPFAGTEAEATESDEKADEDGAVESGSSASHLNEDEDDSGLGNETEDLDDYDPSKPLPPSRFFGGGSNDNDDNNNNDDDDDFPNNNNNDDDSGNNNDDGGNNGNNNNNNNNDDRGMGRYSNIVDDGSLPDFANDKNKQLHAQVLAKEARLRDQVNVIQENSERVSVMKEHLKNVKQEHTHLAQLVEAKSKETETEGHLRALAQRETARMRADATKVEKVISELVDQTSAVKSAIFQANETLEQFKLQMNWNQEELLQWSLAAKQKDEDKAVLEKYEKEDNARLKALRMKVEKLARAMTEKKSELDAQLTESQTVQIALDKAAGEYRRAHSARQDLIRQWNEATEAMMKRDQDIAKTADLIAQAKQQQRELEAEAKAQQNVLDSLAADNKKLELDIGANERLMQNKRDQLAYQKQSLIELEDQVATLRAEAEKAESEVRSGKSLNASLANSVEDKKEREKQMNALLEEAKAELERSKSGQADAAEQAQRMELYHRTITQRSADMEKELQALKENMFKHSHELFLLRKSEADLIADISGAQGSSRNLQARVRQLDTRSIKQQEMLYNIEFQVQQMERKVSHASGKRSLEETVALKEEIQALQSRLEADTNQKAALTNQVRRLHDDLRAARRTHEDALQQKAVLTEKLSQLDLECNSSLRDISEATAQKAQLVLQHDALRLETKRLKETLDAKVEEVYALEGRKAELQLSMREREKEIDIHREVQRAEMKAAEEQRHRHAVELKERQIKLDKLRQKFSAIASSTEAGSGGGSGDDDSVPGMGERSQAYYIIAAAQEREELQRMGDELNREVQKCEREIRLMANSLGSLNQRNENERSRNVMAQPNSEEAKMQQDLEMQQRAVSERMNHQRRRLASLQQEQNQRQNVLAQLKQSVTLMQQEASAKEVELSAAQRALNEQTQQIQRAQKTMQAKRTEYRQSVNNEPTLEEAHVALQEKRRRNALLLNLLQAFTDEHLSEMDNVVEGLASVGLSLPPRPEHKQQRGSTPRRHRRGSTSSNASDISNFSEPNSPSRPDSRSSTISSISLARDFNHSISTSSSSSSSARPAVLSNNFVRSSSRSGANHSRPSSSSSVSSNSPIGFLPPVNAGPQQEESKSPPSNRSSVRKGLVKGSMVGNGNGGSNRSSATFAAPLTAASSSPSAMDMTIRGAGGLNLNRQPSRSGRPSSSGSHSGSRPSSAASNASTASRASKRR